MKLPPLPRHPDYPQCDWTELERITMRVMQIAAARAALEEAARVAEKHFHSMTAKQIRAIKIEGEAHERHNSV